MQVQNDVSVIVYALIAAKCETGEEMVGNLRNREQKPLGRANLMTRNSRIYSAMFISPRRIANHRAPYSRNYRIFVFFLTLHKEK